MSLTQELITLIRARPVSDEDLQQASVADIDATLSSTPAMLLSGAGDVSDVFLVTDLGMVDGVHWVDLRSKVKESIFELTEDGS